MATKAQIRDRAASMLGIFGEGQVLSSKASDDLDESYLEVFAQLDVKEMLTWGENDEIPSEFAPHVVALVALGRITNYTMNEKRLQVILLAAGAAPLEIKELQASNVYQTPRAKYY
jgi:hypothetical protein